MSEATNPTPQVPETEDTKTKKTIRLRPVLSKAAPVINPAAAIKPAAPAAVAPEAAPVSDTQTRKTVKLKPSMPKVAATGKTVDPLAIPKPAAFQPDGNDTKTRKAIQLSQAQATVKPATIDITQAPAAGSTNDDRTVKVKRPAPVAPVTPIIPAAAPAEAPRPALKFNRPAAPAVPKPAAPVVPPKPVAPTVSAVEAVIKEAEQDVYDYDDDETPNKLQLACSIVAAIALLASGTLLALNYFNISL